MKIVIVEDHEMFREVLRTVCADELGHEVVGEAADGRVAVQLAITTLPDLVLLDLHLPKLDGFEVAEALRQATPLVRILALSSHCDDYTVFRAEKARVQGFVDKNTSSVMALKAAITAVGQGQTYFSDLFLRIKANRHRDPHSFDKLLTERERVVLSMVGSALSDTDIAGRLGIAPKTAEKHRFNILKKFGLPTTVQLMRYARDHGFTLASRLGSGGSASPMPPR
ncbi:MAG: response regulator transcription factor [Verrucomicrobiota bacterium]